MEIVRRPGGSPGEVLPSTPEPEAPPAVQVVPTMRPDPHELSEPVWVNTETLVALRALGPTIEGAIQRVAEAWACGDYDALRDMRPDE